MIEIAKLCFCTHDYSLFMNGSVLNYRTMWIMLELRSSSFEPKYIIVPCFQRYSEMLNYNGVRSLSTKLFNHQISTSHMMSSSSFIVWK
jgi:hypothetical protein